MTQRWITLTCLDSSCIFYPSEHLSVWTKNSLINKYACSTLSAINIWYTRLEGHREKFLCVVTYLNLKIFICSCAKFSSQITISDNSEYICHCIILAQGGSIPLTYYFCGWLSCSMYRPSPSSRQMHFSPETVKYWERIVQQSTHSITAK